MIMNNISPYFNSFMENIDELFEKIGLAKAEKDICERAFEACADCDCIDAGSDDYYDSSMGQWYPGDAPEYEITGYQEYREAIAEEITAYIDVYFGIKNEEDEGVFTNVLNNLSDIFQDWLLDEDAFEQRALENC